MTKNSVFEGGKFQAFYNADVLYGIADAEFDDAPGDDGALSRQMVGRRT